ncbi:unnamed protein product, partial [Discosporangium mesarthrocarpum]
MKESTKDVKDISFSPRHLGLQIAAASLDGSVRIYEALDVMNLGEFVLKSELEVSEGNEGVSCLSWCTSWSSPPMLVIGTEGGKVQV